MANDVEPWLRGTHTETDPVRRAVLHALDLAGEDIERWCRPLGVQQLEAMPYGLPSLAFQIRHIARSLDRLMTYAEGEPLSEPQLHALQTEHQSAGDAMQEIRSALQSTRERVLRIDPAHFAEPRGVGRALLPTTVTGLLIHIAEHTQRHVGQAVTTAKLMRRLHDAETS